MIHSSCLPFVLTDLVSLMKYAGMPVVFSIQSRQFGGKLHICAGQKMN